MDALLEHEARRAAPPRESAFRAARRAVLDWVTTLAFLAFVMLPGAPLLLGAAEGQEVRKEFRKPTSFPPLGADLELLSLFPIGFELWFQDRFFSRPTLIRWHNALCVLGLGVDPNDHVAVGRDDWLFLGGATYVDTVRGTNPFSAEELETWRGALEARRAYCEERGARYLFVVAPSKGSIYPEKLPDGWEPVGPTRLDQLLAYLRERSDVALVDLRPALLAAKSTGDLFYPLGMHWNERGGLAAYSALLWRASAWLPELRPRPRIFSIVPSGRPGDSWAPKLYLEDYLRQEDPVLVPRFDAGLRWETLPEPTGDAGRVNVRITTPHESAPRLLVLRDSFGDALVKALAPHFSSSTWVWSRDFAGQWVDRERPDLVIHEMGELILEYWLPDVELESSGLARAQGPAPAQQDWELLRLRRLKEGRER